MTFDRDFWKRPRRGRALAMLVAALCLLHAWMAASVSRQFSTTHDELAHIIAGYAYWTENDYRLQPENGNLPQRWVAIPFLSLKPTPPLTRQEGWRHADVWALGRNFLYDQPTPAPDILAAARLMVAILSGLLCFTLFAWARSMLGDWPALGALIFAAFSPELLAHGGLATSDTAATLGFTLSLLAWARLMQTVTPGRIAGAGAAFAVLALSKYSAALFLPVAFFMIVARFLRRRPLRLRWGGRSASTTGAAKAGVLLGAILASFGLTLALIWAAYGFRFAASDEPQTEFIQTWDEVLLRVPDRTGILEANREDRSSERSAGPMQSAIASLRNLKVLPEAYLYGFAFVAKHAQARLAFFAGEYRTTGWKEFFPAVFALKTTLPLMLGLAAGACALLTCRADRRTVLLLRLSPALVFLLVYGTASILSNLNIGHRHLLPVYPVIYVLAGALFLPARRHPWMVLLPVLLLGWQIRESAWSRPHYLAYFNPLAGGPANAHRLFVDSSLDWGQDLPGLKKWLDAHVGDERVYLSYFGSGDPRREGIEATRIGDGYFDWSPRTTPPDLRGGVYCVSATMLRRVYTQVRGPWDESRENLYQSRRRWLAHANRAASNGAVTDLDGSPLSNDEVVERLVEYEHLLFGRLSLFLDGRTPDAHVGHSILIYRLTDRDVQAALYEPLAEP